MDDRQQPTGAERELDRWLHEEVQVAAPDRLIQDVFARTDGSRQLRRGWLGRVPGLGRSGRHAVFLAASYAAVGLAAVVVVAASLGLRGTTPSVGSTASDSASDAGQSPGSTASTDLAHVVCAARGSLVVLPGIGSARSSAWVTCADQSQEVVLGTPVVTERPGLGIVAGDTIQEWAIRGDSVVLLKPDRTVARSVRIGTPASIAVGSGAVWVLDVRTGSISKIGAAGIATTVSPVPDGRPIALVMAGGSLWMVDQTGARLLRLDPQTGLQVASWPVEPTSTKLVAAAGAVYVTSLVAGTIVRVDPVTGTATTLRPDLGPDGHIDALGGSPDGLLVGSHYDVFRLDPVTGATGAARTGKGYVDAVALSGETALILTDDGRLTETSVP